MPIYKNKGDETNAENYRPITLISCFGKLFTAVLNNRLNSYLEDNGLLNENQAAFRYGYSTTDHIFTLHCLIELLKHQRKNCFAPSLTFPKHLIRSGALVYGKNCWILKLMANSSM